MYVPIDTRKRTAKSVLMYSNAAVKIIALFFGGILLLCSITDDDDTGI